MLLFLWAFLAVGVGLALALALSFHVDWTPMASLMVLSMFTGALFYSGVALALSTVLAPMVAGCGAYLFFLLLPGIAAHGLLNASWIVRMSSHAVYYLGPAQMPEDLLSGGFSQQLLHPHYGFISRCSRRTWPTPLRCSPSAA